MSNIFLLPQISATFVFYNDEDWRDSIQFNNPAGTGPLDLTGIQFTSTLISATGSMLGVFSTLNGTMSNGMTTGMLSWNVSRYPTAAQPICTSSIPPGNATLDLVAYDPKGPFYVQLFKLSGPAAVTIGMGYS